MGWTGLSLQLGLNLSITTHCWKLGDHGVLGKILPSCHGQGPIGACHCECCIAGMQVAPAAWSCWEAVGTGPGLLSHSRAQHMQDCLTSTILLHGGSLLQRTALQLSLLSACPGLFSESFGEHGAFFTTTFTLPRDCKRGARSCQPWTQLQPSAGLTRREAC